MEIQTTRFGFLDVPEENMIQQRLGIQLVQDGAGYTTRHLLGSGRTADDSA